jgi:hypothetical protein
MIWFAYITITGDAGGAGQSKRSSAREVLVNILIGYGISFAANAVILPLYGFQISMHQNLQIGAVFTVISIVRAYVIRRYFNHLLTGRPNANHC